MAYRYSLLNGDQEDPQALQLTLGGMPNVAPVPLQDRPPEPAPPLAVARTPVPLQDVQQPAAAAPAPQQGLTGQEQLQALLQSQLSKRDPELDALYAQREKQALLDSQPKAYGGAELARDVLGTVPAFVLDALVNHGRGAAGIALTGAQAVQQNRAADEAKAKAAADLAIKLRGAGGKEADPLSAALAIGRLGVSQQNAGTNLQRQGTIDKRLAEQSDVNSPLWQARIAGSGQTANAATTARQNALHLLNPQMVSDASNIAGGQKQAEIAATLANAPETAAAAANQAAQVETSKVGAERQAQAANRPPPPGFDVGNQLVYDDVSSDPTRRVKRDDLALSGSTLYDAATKLADLRAKLGPQVLVSNGTGEYDALKLAVVGAANRIVADAGTLNAGEREYIDRMVPGITPNWKDLASWVDGSDLNADQLQGFAKGLQDIITARASHYGLNFVGNQPRAQAPVVGPPQAGAGMPGYNNDGNVGAPNLGDTGGRATPANVPAGGALASPDTVVTIRLNGETARVPLAQAQRLKKANPTLEIGP